MTSVVLHHGLLGGGMGVGRLRWRSFRGVDRAIGKCGYCVFVSAVHPTAGIEKRAGQLHRFLLSLRPRIDRQPVILIAHSLGGLDARYMLSRYDLAGQVAALVTISTPHRGTPYADWCMTHLGRRLRGVQLVRQLGLDLGALPDLTTERCARFNEQIRDVPGVRYYSVSAARPRGDMPVFALFPHGIIYRAEGPNDGLVSVRSAQWGTHLATWRADHWQTVNRQYSWRKRHRPANIIQNYLSLLDAVAQEAGLSPR